MKKFETPEIYVETLDVADVITTSQCTEFSVGCDTESELN